MVDAATQVLGIDDPTFAIVAEYSPHAVTQGFQEMTLFPTAAALDLKPDGQYEGDPLLETLDRSWTETGSIEGKLLYEPDRGEWRGPLTIGYALTRQVVPPAPPAPPAASPAAQAPAAPADKQKTGAPNPKADAAKPKPSKAEAKPAKTPEAAAKPATEQHAQAAQTPEPPKPFTQRITVIGDGDFLSNAFLGNGGNLDLGLNLVQWLGRSDALINIPAKAAPDSKLELSPLASGLIAVNFLFILPLVLIGTGAFIWFKRRRR